MVRRLRRVLFRVKRLYAYGPNGYSRFHPLLFMPTFALSEPYLCPLLHCLNTPQPEKPGATVFLRLYLKSPGQLSQNPLFFLTTASDRQRIKLFRKETVNNLFFPKSHFKLRVSDGLRVGAGKESLLLTFRRNR